MPSPATVIVWFHLRSPELADDFERLMAGDRDVVLGSLDTVSDWRLTRPLNVPGQPSEPADYVLISEVSGVDRWEGQISEQVQRLAGDLAYFVSAHGMLRLTLGQLKRASSRLPRRSALGAWSRIVCGAVWPSLRNRPSRSPQIRSREFRGARRYGHRDAEHAVIALKLALRALSNGDANAVEQVAEGLRYAEEANAELR